MKVIINGITYDSITWEDSGFTMETDMTLSQIEAAFIPGTDTNIIVEEDEQEIARYYNKGLTSIEVTSASPRIVRVKFDLTQISENAEERITSSLEDSDGAIIELAEIVSDLSNIDADGINSELQSHQETIDTWFASASNIMQFINELRMDGGILDKFEARIKALEEAISNLHPVEQIENAESEEK